MLSCVIVRILLNEVFTSENRSDLILELPDRGLYFDKFSDFKDHVNLFSL